MNRNHGFFVRRKDLGEKLFRCNACLQPTRTTKDRQAHAALFRLPYTGGAR